MDVTSLQQMGCQWESPALRGKRWRQDTAAKVIFSSFPCPTQGPVSFKGRPRHKCDPNRQERSKT